MNEHSIANGEMIEKLISDLEMCNIQNEQVNVQDIDQDCKDVGEKANQILDENSIAIGETIERKLSLMKELREIMSKKQTEQVTVQDFKDVGAQNYGEYNIEDFLFDKIIARGSYGYVLKVQLKTTKQIYALKIVNKKCVTDDIDILHTEKHVFVTASNYPFLVGLHSCFQTPSRLCFVMEFVRGFDLWFHMQKMSCLPEKHARFYAAEISLAVNFLHERGIIHRDLKPENVLLDNEGHIKLTDYGLCKKGIRAGDSTSTFCGTPNYMAPEIIRGEDYDFSVDWWALGVLLYEMLAGRSPFDIVGAAENPDQNTKDFLFQVILEKTIRIPLSVSDKAQSILKGFLNKNPAERLGCPQPNGFENITSHAFFKSIDWQLLESKQVSPPYNTNPTVKSNGNTTFTFTRKLMQLKDYLKTDDSKEIENIDQTVFEGFDYVNPLLM